MADIRIKDLAVTAGSSASDDYLAVDGSTNGTRKLSAYSPTFGGNLTVSGTGNNVFRGPIRWGNTSWPGYNGYISEASTDSSLTPAIARNLIGSTGSNYTIANGQLGEYSGFEVGTDIRWFLGSGTFTTGQSLVPTERMRLTYQGRLGVGTTSPQGNLDVVAASNPTINIATAGDTSTAKLVLLQYASGGYGRVQAYDYATGAKPLVLNDLGGNVLIGTTTPTGEKLQVNGTAYVSGNVTFGASITSNSAFDQKMSFVAAASGTYGASNYLRWYRADGTTARVYIGFGSNNSQVFALGTEESGNSLQFKTGADTTALTLDSSQNATFAGFVSSNQGYVAKGTISIPSAAYTSLESSGSVGYLTSYNGSGSVYLPMTYRASKHNFTNGGVNMSALPTSASGLSSGDLWNDSGTLKIV